MKKQVLPIKFRAKVVKGVGRGRKLGIPTINFNPLAAKNLREGIYVCKVFFPSRLQVPFTFWGVLHYGSRLTFGESGRSLEVYLLDFDDSLSIPPELEIELHSYIRKVLRFDNSQEMLKEIKKDIWAARRLALGT